MFVKPGQHLRFQSAPGTCAGRCSVTFTDTSSATRFNPRPARVPGDARSSKPFCTSGTPFQSAPGTCAGRCNAIPTKKPASSSFQSAPGTCAGRCLATRNHRRRNHRFNPRPARVPGDAPTFPALMLTHSAFQSAPGTCAGRCFPLSDMPSQQGVSIRARHVCRAMRGCLMLINSPRCFNPRPARVPGDAPAS